MKRPLQVKIPKKIFLIAGENFSAGEKMKVNELLDRYPTLKGFYWAKEKMREFHQQNSLREAAKLLDNIIFNLESSDDSEVIRRGNSLKHWRGPILNYFASRTTNGFTEGCNTKIKVLKRLSYGLRNVEAY